MIQFYKPNSSNTGSAFGFRLGINNRDSVPCLYMTAIKQHSWDAKTKNGSFSQNAKNPEKSLSVKFNEAEIGGFICAIETYSKFNAYHQFDDNSTSIMLSPYTKKSGDKAFSFGLTRNSANKFGMGLEMSEAYLLAQYLKFVLNKIFTHKTNALK